MKRYLLIGALVACSPALALAQNYNSSTYGPSTGDREFTISGSGSSGTKLDEGAFGLNAELGWYLTDHVEAGVQQSISWSGVHHGDDFWSASTGGFANYQFGTARLRPLVGASLGYAYGNGVEETFYAGVGAGLKYYVLPNTFIKGGAEWQFYFDKPDHADNAFDDGSFVYTVGVGFNF